jgi:hypothetical protein
MPKPEFCVYRSSQYAMKAAPWSAAGRQVFE